MTGYSTLCCNLEEALMVLETGLVERKVAGTGINAVSSRSHGFFCVEVKKRNRMSKGPWIGSTLTIVDLAGRSLSKAFYLLHAKKKNFLQAPNAPDKQRRPAQLSRKLAKSTKA